MIKIIFYNKKNIIALFLVIFFVIFYHSFFSSKLELIKYNKDNNFVYFKVQDYAYHILIVKSFWFENFGDIYKLDFQQKALSSYLGSDISLAMPLGITPVALMVWLPFAYLANFSMALSYSFWSSVSLILLFFSLWKFLRKRYQENKTISLPFYLVIVSIFSPAAFGALLLGQTSIFAVGLIVLIIDYVMEKKEKRKNLLGIAYISILVFMVGIKPTYLVIAFGLLAIYGMWKEAFFSGFFLLAYFIAISFLLGIDWVFTYKNLLEMYNSGNFPQVYSWSIVPGTMNIFRSAFANIVGDNIGVKISNSITIGIYFIVLFYITLIQLGKIGKNFKIGKKQVFILLLSSYLLFAPYAGSYEDMFFIVLFLMLFQGRKLPRLIEYKGLIIALLTMLVLSQVIINTKKIMWILWTVKFIIISVVMFYSIRPSREFLSIDPDKYGDSYMR